LFFQNKTLTLQKKIMAIFSFFKQQRPNQFEYKPRFYDPEIEKRREKLKTLRKDKETELDEKEEYAPGNIIRGSMKSKIGRKEKKTFSMTRIAIFIVFLILVIYLIRYADLSNIISKFIK